MSSIIDKVEIDPSNESFRIFPTLDISPTEHVNLKFETFRFPFD